MSVTGKRGIGIPAMVLYDAEGCVVTVETKVGDSFRGTLRDCEDSMNCVLEDCVKTDRTGAQRNVSRVYIRGSQIALIMLPDMLSKAPELQRYATWKKHKGNPPSMAVSLPRGPGGRHGSGGRGGRGGGRCGRGFAPRGMVQVGRPMGMPRPPMGRGGGAMGRQGAMPFPGPRGPRAPWHGGGGAGGGSYGPGR